jgi:predicted O-methyltransferase YrrM
MSELTNYLFNLGITEFEGNSQQIERQITDLINLSKKDNIKVMEIGFNAGHSANIFLQNNNTLILTSFDIGFYRSVEMGKKFIDEHYPNRHTLILGDSKITLPKFIENNPQIKFDLIFIDGGHDFETALADVTNSLQLCHSDTVIIMDDVVHTKGWEQHYTIGPTRAWKFMEDAGKISTIYQVDYCYGRGMIFGKIK